MLRFNRSIAVFLVALCIVSGLTACNGSGNSSGRDLYMLVLRDAGGSTIRVRTSSNGTSFSQKATVTGMAPSGGVGAASSANGVSRLIGVQRGDEIRLKYGLGSAQWSAQDGPAALSPGGQGNVVSPFAASTPSMTHLSGGADGDQWLVAFQASGGTLAVHTYNSGTGRISAANLAPLDSRAQSIQGIPQVARSVRGNTRDIKVVAWRTNGGGINAASVSGPISALQTPAWQVGELNLAGILNFQVGRVSAPALTADQDRFYLGFISERTHPSPGGAEPLTERGIDVLESADGLSWQFARRVELPSSGRGFEEIGLAADGAGNVLVLAAAENPGVNSVAARLTRTGPGAWTFTSLNPARVFGRAERPTTQHFTLECTRLP